MNAVALVQSQGNPLVVATHSSGNHGTALALAAREAGLKAIVVMPKNSARAQDRRRRAPRSARSSCASRDG